MKDCDSIRIVGCQILFPFPSPRRSRLGRERRSCWESSEFGLDYQYRDVSRPSASLPGDGQNPVWTDVQTSLGWWLPQEPARIGPRAWITLWSACRDALGENRHVLRGSSVLQGGARPSARRGPSLCPASASEPAFGAPEEHARPAGCGMQKPLRWYAHCGKERPPLTKSRRVRPEDGWP